MSKIKKNSRSVSVLHITDKVIRMARLACRAEVDMDHKGNSIHCFNRMREVKLANGRIASVSCLGGHKVKGKFAVLFDANEFVKGASHESGRGKAKK